MKSVLIATPCLLNGGTEWQTLRLVEALNSGGYNTLVVCYFEYSYDMVQRFQQAGSRVCCLSAYGKRPQGILKTYRFLNTGFKRVLTEYHPEVAHIQYMAPGALPIFILRRLGIKTIIATLHTDADIYKSLKLIHFLQRHILRAFTCVSAQAEKHFFGTSNIFETDSTLKKRNHITIPNCLPSAWSQSTATKPTLPDTNSPVIGLVSRLEHIKGVDYVLPQFALLLKNRPQSKLLIVGDGKMRQMMEEQQQQLGIAADHIEWAGQVAHHLLNNYYERVDILWMPSRSEGFGLSAIEAHAHAIPVLATTAGGLLETVHNQQDGMIVEPTELADKTNLILDNTELFATLQQGSLNNAQNYSFERYQKRILNLYSQLFNR